MADKDSDPTGGRERDEPEADGQTGQQETSGEPEPAETGVPKRPDSQAELLAEMKALRRRARTARHAYWFPLVLFGLLTCASVPFYVPPGHQADGTGAIQAGPPLPILGGFPGFTVQRFLGYYWLAALLGGLLLTLLWYRRNARRVGLATPARGYIITTAALTVLALVLPLLSQVRSPHWLSWLQYLSVLWPGDLVVRGTFPFVIIAAGLWVLAWAERSRALAVIAAALHRDRAAVEPVQHRERPVPARLESLSQRVGPDIPAERAAARARASCRGGRRVRGAAAPPDQDVSPAADPQPEQPGLEHPTNGIDETVHQRHRLGILTITAEAQRAEFGYLREALGLTPGNLSKHLTVLEQAGMVEVEKGYAGRSPADLGTHHRPGPRGARRRTRHAHRTPPPAHNEPRHLTSKTRQTAPSAATTRTPEHRTIIRYTFTSSPAVHNQRDWAGMCAPPKSGGNHAA